MPEININDGWQVIEHFLPSMRDDALAHAETCRDVLEDADGAAKWFVLAAAIRQVEVAAQAILPRTRSDKP